MSADQFSLCWDNFHSNMSSGLSALLKNEDLVDVTLAAEGQYLKAHKMVLSVCSPYFKELFQINPCKHPIVFLKDVSYSILSSLIEFMYQGEVKVSQNELATFIKTAEAMKIKGLTGEGTQQNDPEPTSQANIISTEEVSNRKTVREREKTPPPRKKPMGPASKRIKIDSEPSRTLTPNPQQQSSPPPQPQQSQVPSQLVSEIKPVEQLMHFKLEPEETAVSLVNEEDVTYDDTAMDEIGIDNSTDYLMESATQMDPKAGTSTMDNVEATGDNQECVIRIVQGPRGAAQLIVKNYMFLKRSTMGVKTYWRCCMYSRFNCRARCVTGEDGSLVQYCEHSHKPDLQKLVNRPVLRETIYKINAE